MIQKLLIGLTLVMVPLSGCIGGVGTISAMDGRDAALDHVFQVLGDDVQPTLVGVASIEPFKHYIDDDEGFEINTYADAVQGDGKIPGWVYGYCVGANIFTVFMAAGIGVLADFREEGDCADAWGPEHAISEWNIDSDEAATILAEHSKWPAPTEDAYTIWILQQIPESDLDWYDVNGLTPGTYWDVEMESTEVRSSALVDAQTGEIVFVESGPIPEYIEYQGEPVELEEPIEGCEAYRIEDADNPTVDATEPYTLEMDLPGEGTVDVDLKIINNAGSVAWELTSPSGTKASGANNPNPLLGAGGGTMNVGGGAGIYTLTITAQALAQVEFDITGTYCA